MAVSQTPPAAADRAVYGYQDMFPGQFPGVGFEMPRQVFVDLLASTGLAYRSTTAGNIFAVGSAGSPFTEVVYFFNSPACDCLTEIEIRFADEARSTAYFISRFPKVNIQGEFVGYDNISTYTVKAWRFQSKVFVVAVLPNTRWPP